MSFRYTPEQLRFLQRGFKRMRVPELTKRFNLEFRLDKTACAIRSALKNHRFTCGRPKGNPKGSYRLFTQDQAEWIREAYRHMTCRQIASELTRQLGRKIAEQQIKTFVSNHGIKSGRTGCFEKGSKPWNKGTHYVAGGRSAETRFRKGQKPQTWVPVGTEVVDRDGYLKRKVRDDAPPGKSRFNWRFVHVLVWEEHHGPIPDGHAVIFRDGDKANLRIENLALVSRAELLYLNRNGLTGLGELSPAAEALAKLETTRYEREKEVA